MSNPIQLNKQTIDSINQGATKVLLGIDNQREIEQVVKISKVDIDPIDIFIMEDSPLQIGQEYYLQEECCKDNRTNEIYYNGDIPREAEGHFGIHKQSVNDMQEHQSRIKFKVLNIEVKRVQEIEFKEMSKFILRCESNSWISGNIMKQIRFCNWYNEQYKNYKDNPFVFIVEIERK